LLLRLVVFTQPTGADEASGEWQSLILHEQSV